MRYGNRKYKIGVFGSSEDDFSYILQKAQSLGNELAKRNVIVVTGASSGIPYEVALSAYKRKAEIWGFSYAVDISKQQEFSPSCDLSIYKKLTYIPNDYRFSSLSEVCKKYRNVTSTAVCDAGIIISGRWGTLNEFTNLYDMGKVIGVLSKTEGIANELPRLLKIINKESKAKVIFEDSPAELVDKIIRELKAKS